MSEASTACPRLIKRQQVEDKVALSCSAIYARLDPKSPYFDPTFPRPIKLGNGKKPPVAWNEQEVDSWIASRIAASRAAA